MKVVVTDYKKGIFWEEQEKLWEKVDAASGIFVYPGIKRQRIHGFGGAFTESAAYCFHRLTPEGKEELLKAYFTEKGLDYTIGRSHINSCDFSLSNYAADENEEDPRLSSFSLQREKKYILPFILEAQRMRRKKIKLLFSPWSPPAYMKTNRDMNHGGSLKEEYYSRWAEYVVRYIKEMKKEGCHASWLTVQNEPAAVQVWDSCIYTEQQEAVFAGEYLGPALEKGECGEIGLFAWDHNKECAYERADKIFSNEAANTYVNGIAVHWYTGDYFEDISMIRERFPEKEIFFTEGCVEYSKFDKTDEIYKAEMYAHDMAGNFRNGVSAFFDWNLLLDSKGGPNHVGNYCDAPVMCGTDFDKIDRHLSYYYIGHFSRYVKEGAHVISASAYCREIEYAAFLNPDGERVMVLLNRQEKPLTFKVCEGGKGIPVMMNPHTIATVCWYL